jgi:drug/metabolite transporter (DMT)-like permease
MTGPGSLPAPARGVLWMLAQAAAMVVTMVAVRKLSPTFSVFELVFIRALVGLAIQMPWLIRAGTEIFRPPRIGLVTLRSCFVIVAMLLWFTALGAMPVSDAVALQFTLPLFAIAGAGLILRETVGMGRWLAVVIGFCGAMVIIRPGFAEVNPYAILVLLTAVLVAGVQLTTKVLANAVTGTALVFHMNLMMLPLSLGAAVPVWVTPNLADLPWLLAIGVFGSVAHIFMARAMAAADASLVAPVDFARLPLAALFGWFLFGETSDLWTWVGAAVIFASTTYIIRLDPGTASRHRAPDGAPSV